MTTICSRRTSWRKTLGVTCALLALLALGHAASAAYPDKPVRIVVGFPAGGTTDLIARLMAKEMSEALGQPFVVENKPGAGSNIAAEQVARSPHDGYTLCFLAVTSAINQTLYPKLKFNLVDDFSPVALAAKVPNFLLVSPQSPFTSVSQLVAYAKAHPNKLAFASSGAGTSNHIAGELLKIQAGIDILHVPYKGSSQGLVDLIGEQVQLMFDNSALPYVQSGRLRALAVTTRERSPSAPTVPTMIEAGFPDFEASSWFGMVAPAGTSPDIIGKLNAAMVNSLDKPEVKAALDKLGAVGAKTTPAQFSTFIKSEVDRWAPVVRASGAKVE